MAKALTAAFYRTDRSAFVSFITAAYPKMEDTVPLMLALQEGGTDVIELGVPFTDPQADGATIQHTNEVLYGRHVLESYLHFRWP